MANTIIGVFDNRTDAEHAVDELKANGYNPKDISIIMRDTQEGEALAAETGADVAGGTASGAVTGAVVGSLAGLLASIAIPGLGAFFIGGPIAAALGLTGAAAATASGAATGALAGGLIGLFTSMGLSEADAKNYEARVNEGGIFIAVPTEAGESQTAERILKNTNADDIKVI